MKKQESLKATIHKANLQIADVDRGFYADHAVTIARHPSETDERMMVRLLALALHLPDDGADGALELAKDLWDPDEPAFLRRDFTGQILHWVEVGQPDDRRLLRAAGRAERVTVLSYSTSTPIWWSGIANKVSRAANIAVWQIPPRESQALAALARRSMQLQVLIQDGMASVSDAGHSVEVTPLRLSPS